MLRELVKWDYELRMPDQIGDVVARAVEVAMAHPRGPVYLVLPREPLSAPLAEPIAPIKPRAAGGACPSRSAHDRDARRMDRRRRAAADHHRHLAGRRGAALERLAERCAIPVVAHNPRTVCLPSSHPMHFGFEPGALLDRRRSRDRARIRRAVDSASAASAGRLPRRPYRRGPVLRALSDAQLPERSRGAGRRDAARWRRSTRAVEPRLQMAEARIAARRARLTERMRTRRAQLAKDSARRRRRFRRNISRARSARRSARTRSSSTNIRCGPIIARARSRAPSSRSARPAVSAGASARRSAPSSPRPTSSSSRRSATAPTCSPIRWSATGSSAKHELPILTVVFNNSRYGAVRRATLSMFKDGVAGETDGRTLADLDPAPPYEEMAQAQGAYAERVEKPADLPDALARARASRRQRAPPGAAQRHYALLNVPHKAIGQSRRSACVSTPIPISSRRNFSPRSSRAATPTSASACARFPASTISTSAARSSIGSRTTRRSCLIRCRRSRC